MTVSVRIALLPEAFGLVERPLVAADAGEITGFRYSSGIEALRVRTDRLEMVVLPFTGQQIWRLAIDGEDLTMRTMFDEPLDVPAFGLSYGPFMMHCGLAGMGNPGPADLHPPHGELPLRVTNAPSSRRAMTRLAHGLPSVASSSTGSATRSTTGSCRGSPYGLARPFWTWGP